MSESVPECARAGGNTKTPATKKPVDNPCKRWCFTLNNYTENEFDSLKIFVPIVPSIS